MKIEENYNKLKEFSISQGISIFGVDYIDDLRPHFDGLSLEQTEGLSYGISIGVRVSDSVLKGIIDSPTRHYLHHYKMLNLLLDQTALRISLLIQEMGYRSLPIPASQIIDWQRQTAHLSHKMIALRAGIGWIGRNNLIVHPMFGSKIRLATILTDAPLKTDKPIETSLFPPLAKERKEFSGQDGCGNCRKCIEICPVSAIGETYKEWDKTACLEKLKYFARTYNIGQYICGLCVRVCKPQRSLALMNDK